MTRIVHSPTQCESEKQLRVLTLRNYAQMTAVVRLQELVIHWMKYAYKWEKMFYNTIKKVYWNKN